MTNDTVADYKKLEVIDDMWVMNYFPANNYFPIPKMKHCEPLPTLSTGWSESHVNST